MRGLLVEAGQDYGLFCSVGGGAERSQECLSRQQKQIDDEAPVPTCPRCHDAVMLLAAF